VVVALFVLTVSGVAAVTMAAESARAVEHAHNSELRMRGASDFLEAVSLWTRADLDRRLGDRSQGPWRLVIDNPYSDLYIVMLTDSLRHPLLRTALFRPNPTNDRP
jgi:hypothetical protein